MIDLRMKSQLFPIRKIGKNTSRTFEFILWIVPVALVIFSSLLIASTQRQEQLVNWYDHCITALLGILIAAWLAQLPLERIRVFLRPIYLLTIFSLIFVKLFGTSALGAQRWISVGTINIQPSEIAKLTSIIVLAAVLERNNFRRLSNLFKPIIIIFIPWSLVFIQPDLGTSLVFGAILFSMLFWSGMPFEWGLIVIASILTIIFSATLPYLLLIWIPLMGFMAFRSLPNKKVLSIITMSCHGILAWLTPWLWNYGLKDYQRDRLILFLDPAKDPLGGGYHLLQSKIGIGSGGFWGTGLLQGQLTKLRFIPEQHTDFIFSALGEETGFLGTMFVVIAFFIFMLRLLKIAKDARTDFESLVVIGIGTMFIFQVVVNIFMTIGLGPVTGIPLPFMSYGRTALLVNFTSLGLCLSVARRSQTLRRNW